ncbi:S1C family serine protease [Pelagibacterium sp.]|uniref:S1C family serine protease n=1 Tax=Pelagibacterium sp. TaxID=1967288 RepID=UPI003A903A4A
MESWVFPLRALVLAVYLAVAQTAVGATPALDEPFDPADFTPAEIQILQRALTFTGHYAGLWDGEWGPLSASAVQSYSQANFGGEEVVNYGLIPLILDGMARVDELEWTETYLPRYDVTIGLPASLVREQYSSTGTAFLGEGIGVEVLIEDPAELTVVHNNLARAAIGTPYIVRSDQRWVTAVRTEAGSSYLRSDWTGRSWVSLWVDVAPFAEDHLSYISASYRFGPLKEIEDAEIVNLVELLLRAAEELEEDDDGAARGTGTGFFIAPDIIVTNHHVVAQCSKISTPDGLTADILASTELVDLAVLRYSGRSASFLSISTEDDIRLGREVSAVGYPLYGLVNTGLNFTTGVVSAVNGFADDEANFTLTAPLQPGNSGGPVIDSMGTVLGVAVATASLQLAEIGGFIPQNINWAVKGSTLRRFLDGSGIEYQTKPQKTHIFDAGLPDGVAAAVTPIVCE